ncbi:MAG: T9SS type A sorting domain-containing protein, partial [Candidatus Aminicenantaceae bacterium]
SDGGVTWSDTMDLGMPHVQNEVYGAVPIRGTNVVVAVGENSTAGKPRAWWSTDMGMTYSRLDPGGNNELYHSAFRSATDGWAVGHTQVYRYTAKTLRKVTFTCNTATVPDTIPVAGSTIQIRGGSQGGGFSPITWGSEAQNNMFNVGGDYWSKTMEMQVGDTLRYKLVVNYASGTGWEQGVAGTFPGEGDNSNRAFVVPDQDTTLEVEFWNNGASDRPQYFRPWVDAPDTMMTVYFRVSMLGPMSSGSFSFDDHADTVGVRGGGPAGGDLNWSPTYYLTQEMAQTNGDGYTIAPNSMWSGGLQFPKSGLTEGQEISYKFLIGYDWGRDELQGQDNRAFNVPVGMKDTTLQWVFFNNERPSERENPDTIAIQFRANLAAAISSGGFAIGDTLHVHTGYFGTASDPGREKMMVRVAGTTYLVTDTIITRKDALLDYQYYHHTGGVTQRENYYNFFYAGDVQAEAERRQVMVDAGASLSSPMIVNDTATSIINPRRQPDFPNARPLARDVKVTYEVDIRPAFYQVLQGDTLEDIQGEIDVHAGVVDSLLEWGVWMNGLAVGDWGNPTGGDWGLGLRDNLNKKMWDDGTNGDVSGGDTTFSRIVMIGPDSTTGSQGRVGQTFKFGIYGGDNEGGAGGFGNNHLENVVDTDTIYTLNSQFGSINPAFYDAWDYDLRQPVFPTSVIDAGQPLIYQLAQNYPNPFNPATKIRYSIPAQSYVVLKVYNALGQEVMTLVDGAQKPGIHTVKFDARNLASGIYFYRITAGDFVNVKKMMLLK